MDSSKKLIVGYDLCEDYSQISCFSYKSMEPITIGLREEDTPDCPIPSVLCLKTETKQWLYGEEALACERKGEGLLIDQLLTKVINGDEIEIYQTKFTGIALLEKFLRKSLTLIKNYFPTEPITKLVVTVRETDPVLVEGIYDALAQIGIEKDRATVMSHASAYLYYALSQDKALWLNDVGLFDLRKEGFQYHQIRINRRTKPMIASLVKQDYSQELDVKVVKENGNRASYLFENLTNTIFHKQLVTTLYFTGKGFEGGWADEVIRKLCVGRRVFQGQNLYSKGACYAAKELAGDKLIKDVLLLNDDMVTTSVAVRVYVDTKYKDIPLVEAGEIWYEVDKTLEVIPDGGVELDLLIGRIMTRELIHEKVPLNQFPIRLDRTSRLKLQFSCKTRNQGIIKITDLGFGEFFPGSGAEMEIALEI